MRHESLDAESGSEYYVPYTQAPEPFMSLVVRSSTGTRSACGSVREAIKQMDKINTWPIQPMTKLIAESVARRRFNALLTDYLQWWRCCWPASVFWRLELHRGPAHAGNRTARGPWRKTSDVLRLVLGQGVRLILLGLGLGLAASFALTRVLASCLRRDAD